MRLQGAVPLLLVLAVPSLARASEFTDFRIPAHSWRSWNAATSGQWQIDSRSSPGETSRDRRPSADASVGVRRFHDSDPWRWDAGVEASARGHWSFTHSDQYDQFPLGGPATSTVATARSQHGSSASERCALIAGVRGYPGDRPLGFEVRGSIRGDEDQDWSHQLTVFQSSGSGGSSRQESASRTASWRYAETARLDFVAGWGRVRDATGVFDAQLLAERLCRDGVLGRDPSPAALRKLAELFTIEGAFSVPHDQPDRFFWREVERLLKEDGALAGDRIGAYASHHAAERLVVAGGGFLRRSGMFVGPVVSATHQHQLVRSDFGSGMRSFTDGTRRAARSPPRL